jgi:general L-amino acid transport system permease protein
VARRRGEFLGLTHIDNDNGIAGREAALQLHPMLPLFLPPGVTIDKLLRAQAAFMLFAAAYLAEAPPLAR